LQKSLSDGHSTSGSAGTGLGAVQRNSDVFGVSSALGKGTAVFARVRLKGYPAQGGYVVANVTDPYPGETTCGDGWAVKRNAEAFAVILADGSGHGPLACAAADRAKAIFAEQVGGPIDQVAERIHRALAPTRGAAIAIAEIHPGSEGAQGRVNFVGIGNISAALLDGGNVRRMISHNGTAGHLAPRIRMFQYPCSQAPTIVMHSDGLSSRWNLDEYAGLAAAHPSLISGILYRDYRRGRDDATIVTVRGNF
jgi:hypothetical protein